MSRQEQFLEQTQHLALYGLSGSGKGFAYDVKKAVLSVRPKLRISPIHPSATALGGLQAQPSASRLNPRPDSALIVLKPEDAAGAVEDAASAGVKSVWLVLNAASKANVERAQGLGLEVVQGCPMLFMTGQSFPHNFHRALAVAFKRI